MNVGYVLVAAGVVLSTFGSVTLLLKDDSIPGWMIEEAYTKCDGKVEYAHAQHNYGTSLEVVCKDKRVYKL